MNRKFMLTTILLLVAASLTSWLAIKMVQATSQIHLAKAKNPDAFMVDVTYTSTNKEGKVANIIHSPYARHYPYHNFSSFNSPQITIPKPHQQPWHITASYGTAENGTQVVKLINNVLLAQNAGPNNKSFTISSEQATIYPQDKYVTTNKAVTIKQPGMLIKAVGAKANLNSKLIKLLSQVQETQTTSNGTTSKLNSQQASYNGKTATSIYSGNVKYRKETTNLDCQKLVIRSSKSLNKIYKIVAYGQQAHYSTLPKGKKQRVYADADMIQYYPTAGLAELIGAAKVTQAGDQFSGNKITYNEQQQRVVVTPAGKTQIKIKFTP